jgi:2-polyprenyl-6-methoxyphenol hydroxylase-like FAD-dependent oxidoreductase
LDLDTARLQLSGGGEAVAERLIAADGAASAVRSSLRPESSPVYRGYVGWRALVDFCPPGWEEGRVTESWGRGRRFGIAPVGGGRTYWYASANVPASALPMTPSLARVRRDFADWHSPIPELLEATQDDALLLHPISDHAPFLPPHWDERVVLLGDAAHPLTPNLGQGASLALEDAWELACTWRSAGGFAAYAKQRRARVNRLWSASRRLGGLIQWEHPFLCAARDLATNVFPDSVATVLMRQLLRHQPGDLIRP